MKIPLYARNFEDWNSHKTKLEIWANKKKHIIDIPFKPYFYSKTVRHIPIADFETEELTLLSDLRKEKLFKYSFQSVKDIVMYRDEETCESDVPYLQRVAIDREDFYTQFPQTDPLDILYFDIETDTTGLFPKPKRNIIASISYALNQGDVVTYSVNDIKEGDKGILQKFLDDIEKLNPDILVGYNFLSFDLPYIIDRAIINNLSTSALTRNKGEAYFVNQKGQTILNIQGRALFDVFEEVLKDQTLYGISGRGLKDVAKWFNIDQKVRSDPRYKDYEIVMEFRGNMRELIGTPRMKNYIESDVLITRALSEFYFNNIATFSEMVKVPINMMTRRTVNLFGTIIYARELKKIGIISDNPNFKRFPKIYGDLVPDPKRPNRSIFQGGTSVQGALVGIFKDGKPLPLFNELKECYTDIWKLDFRGMYGSIQETFNLSPETTKIIAIEPLRSNNEVTFEDCGDSFILGIPDRKVGLVKIRIIKKLGFLPRIIRELTDTRNQIKKRLKDPSLPKHEKESLESLSWSAKVIVAAGYGINKSGFFRYGDPAITIATTGIGRMAMQYVLDQNPKANILCDTDGVYMIGKPDLEKYNYEVNKFLTEKFGVNNVMELEIEGPFPNGYFLKRKNYVLQRPNRSIIKHGNSFKGTSKNMLYAYAMDKLIKTIFDKPEEIENAIKECFKLNDRDLKEFIQKTKINRPLNEYDSGSCLQMQVANQMKHLHEIEIEQGDSIDYVKQETGYVIKDSASIDKIDRKYYIKQIEGVLRRLNLTKVTIDSKANCSGHKRHIIGKSGFIYEGDGQCSKQLTLGESS